MGWSIELLQFEGASFEMGVEVAFEVESVVLWLCPLVEVPVPVVVVPVPVVVGVVDAPAGGRVTETVVNFPSIVVCTKPTVGAVVATDEVACFFTRNGFALTMVPSTNAMRNKRRKAIIKNVCATKEKKTGRDKGVYIRIW
jgi:hypothetical protein